MSFQRLLLCVGLVAAAGCGQRKVVTEQDFVKTVGEAPAASSQARWEWSYSGERGPENWGGLNPQYKTCSSGKLQSPVNLIWRAPKGNPPLEVTYKPTDVIVANTGYTFRMEFTPQSQVTYKGKDYLLEKAEVRSPSEHRFSGKKLPLEIQFYHRSSNGLRQAMISLFAVKGKENPWIEKFLGLAQATAPYKSSSSVRLNPADIIPEILTFYHYQGSLTHPPCLEGVDWFVLNTPIQVSEKQIAKFKALYNNNNRPLQDLNGRQVQNY